MRSKLHPLPIVPMLAMALTHLFHSNREAYRSRRTAKSSFDEHEKQVTQLSESALGKLRDQAESVTSEATGQLRESLQSWQDENQKRIHPRWRARSSSA